MTFKNDNVGLAVGTFIGAAIGTVSTILFFKKIINKEIEKKTELEKQHVEEITSYYEAKISKLKTNKDILDVPACVATAATAEKIATTNENKKSRITYENLNIDNIKTSTNNAVDYSKISRDRYSNLQKEYEREEIQEEYDEVPHQITKANWENGLGYKKLELMYYEKNDIFTYMDDTICNNVTPDIIGRENLSLFGTDDASIDGMSGMYDLYLRSNKIMTDFHLIYNGSEDYYKINN